MNFTHADLAALGRRRTPREALRTEREIQAAVLALLPRIPGVIAWRNNVGAVAAEHKGQRRFVRFGRPGLPDIMGWVRRQPAGPVPLFIECKAPRGELRPEQRAFLALATEAGCVAFVARSCEDVVREFQARGILS